MHVLIATGPFQPLPPGPAGAVERIWAETAPEMVRQGHQVTFVARALDGGERYPEAEGVNIVPVPGFARTGSPRRDVLLDAKYSRRALRHFPAADVAVVNTFWLPVLAAPLRKRRDFPLIYMMQRFPKKHFQMYRNLDRVLAVSGAVEMELRQAAPFLIPRTRVVPNAINTTAFHRTRAPGSGDTGSPVILYTGRIHPEKGVHLLVEAVARLVGTSAGGVRLRLIGASDVGEGGGGQKYLDLLKELAGNDLTLDVRPQILNREALAEALRSCDIYCYPSVADRGESFGVAPLEAMAVGCPTVVSGLECFGEFLENGRNGLAFDHRGADPVGELTATLASLLADPALARRLGDAGALTAEHFSNEAIARRYLEVFEEAVTEKRHAST